MNIGTFSPDIRNVSQENIESRQQDISVSGVMSTVYIIISVIGKFTFVFRWRKGVTKSAAEKYRSDSNQGSDYIATFSFFNFWF